MHNGWYALKKKRPENLFLSLKTCFYTLIPMSSVCIFFSSKKLLFYLLCRLIANMGACLVTCYQIIALSWTITLNRTYQSYVTVFYLRAFPFLLRNEGVAFRLFFHTPSPAEHYGTCFKCLHLASNSTLRKRPGCDGVSGGSARVNWLVTECERGNLSALAVCVLFLSACCSSGQSDCSLWLAVKRVGHERTIHHWHWM